jgi:hypothetical protein
LNIDDLKNAVKSTAFFKKLEKKQQQQSLKGEIQPKRKWEELVKAASFSETFRKIYAYQSAFVHSTSISVIQTSQADTDKKMFEYVHVTIGLVMMILGKMIVNYVNIYPGLKQICSSNEEMFTLAKALSISASKL